MNGKFLLIFVILLGLSACNRTGTNTEIASLYTGYEEGSWYKFSNSCSAKLCPAY
jgi:hypothetical protein